MPGSKKLIKDWEDTLTACSAQAELPLSPKGSPAMEVQPGSDRDLEDFNKVFPRFS